MAGPQYTTSPMLVEPSAATGVSVSPSGTGGVFGSWVQLHASLPADWHITGLTLGPTADPADGGLIWQIGTGGAGAETAIIEHDTQLRSFQFGSIPHFPFPAPRTIPAGTRVSIRVRHSSTSTTAWRAALNYISGTPGGEVRTTTANISRLTAGFNTAGSAWANTSWTQLTASTGGIRYLYDITPAFNTASQQVEIDIGVGGSGSEVVIHTFRGMNAETPLQTCLFLLTCWPLVQIGSGVRVSMRYRVNTGFTIQQFCSIHMYDAPSEDFSGISTTAVQKWVPSAADMTTVNGSGSAWANPASYTQMVASTGQDRLITAVCWYLNGNTDAELDIAVGTVGNEVVITTLRGMDLWGQGRYINLTHPVFAASGSRVACRVRGNSVANNPVALGYLELSTHLQLTTKVAVTAPPANTSVTVTPNGTAFNNSGYGELIASIGFNAWITHVFLNPGGSVPAQVEVDLAVGAAASEVVKTTYRSRVIVGSRRSVIWFAQPLRVDSASRIAVRIRKDGTETNNWTIGIRYEQILLEDAQPLAADASVVFDVPAALLAEGENLAAAPSIVFDAAATVHDPDLAAAASIVFDAQLADISAPSEPLEAHLEGNGGIVFEAFAFLTLGLPLYTPGSRPPRYGVRWHLCARCGIEYPLFQVKVQKGMILCDGPGTKQCCDEPGRQHYVKQIEVPYERVDPDPDRLDWDDI